MELKKVKTGKWTFNYVCPKCDSDHTENDYYWGVKSYYRCNNCRHTFTEDGEFFQTKLFTPEEVE